MEEIRKKLEDVEISAPTESKGHDKEEVKASSMVFTEVPKNRILNKKGEWIEKPGPNRKCHCGSGGRYKKCCQEEDNIKLTTIKEKIRKEKDQLYIDKQKLSSVFI